MTIEAVDFFPLAMPKITTETHGSQSAVTVRVAGGGSVDGPAHVARSAATVAYDSMDLLQAAHPRSGVVSDATPSA